MGPMVDPCSMSRALTRAWRMILGLVITLEGALFMVIALLEAAEPAPDPWLVVFMGVVGSVALSAGVALVLSGAGAARRRPLTRWLVGVATVGHLATASWMAWGLASQPLSGSVLRDARAALAVVAVISVLLALEWLAERRAAELRPS